MKKLLIICLTLLAVSTMLLLTGCSAIFHTSGTGQIVEKTYDFKDFTNVEISNAYQYEITQSDNYSVVVSTPESLVDHLDIHISGNTLYIGMKFVLFSSSNLKITITMPQLINLSVTGACNGTATGFDSNSNLEIYLSGASRLDANFKAGITKLDIYGDSRITGNLTAADTEIILSGASDLNMTMQTGNMVITASGSSDIRGSLQAADCQFNLSGASTCNISGAAGKTVIAASGASDFISSGFTVQTADVKLTGASDASIRVNGTMNVDISGASTLNYSGNPTIGKIDISGASKMNHQK
jgi:hypothetical protein